VQWRGKSIVETRRQTKQLEMPVAVLPNVKNEQLLFVTLDFKTVGDVQWVKKFLNERSDLVAARVVFLKAMHEIKKKIDL